MFERYVAEIYAVFGAQGVENLYFKALCLDDKVKNADGQVVEPEVSVFVALGLPELAAAVEAALRADYDLLFDGIIYGTGNEFAGDIAVIYAREEPVSGRSTSAPSIQSCISSSSPKCIASVGQASTQRGSFAP